MAVAPIEQTTAPAPRAYWGRVVLFIGALAAFALIPLPLCPIRLMLRIPCPGCGATRSILCALHLDFVGSWRLHPLAIPAAVLLVPSLVLVSKSIAKGDPTERLPRPLRIAWTIWVAAALLLWVARFFGAFGGPAPV